MVDSRVPRSAVSARLAIVVLNIVIFWPSARGDEPRFTPADYHRHAAEMVKRLPRPNFTIVVEPPFVVAGDEPAEVVRRHCRETIHWAVDRLKRAYFSKDPEAIIDIWLFCDQESYQKHCQTLFGQAPTSPYGFYNEADRAVAVNIATGGGTLVHEIVHAFMAANFPGCPAWFNEGLGALYEQATDRDGEIVGLTNWRLAGLQRAIETGRLGSFERLFAMSDQEFYRDERGTNYAQARYLCYYLQQQGLLRAFYHRFVANRERDRSGCYTLREVLRRDDMKQFQREWEEFVLKLKFREGVPP